MFRHKILPPLLLLPWARGRAHMLRGVVAGDADGELAIEPLAVDALGLQGGLEAATADALGAEGEGGEEEEHEDGGVDSPLQGHGRVSGASGFAKTRAAEKKYLYKRRRRRAVDAASW